MLGDHGGLQHHLVALGAQIGGQPQLPPRHAGGDQRAGAQGMQGFGQAVGLRIFTGGTGQIAHRAQAARHQGQGRLLDHAHDDVHIVAQIVGPVLEQHVEHDARVQALELDQPFAHHDLAVAAGHADAHATLQALAQRRDGLACGQHFVVDVAPVLIQAHADLRGLHAARGALDQLHARCLFQLGQVIAHIGTRHLELARCLAEIAAINDFDQQGQRLGVHGVFVQFPLTVCQ